MAEIEAGSRAMRRGRWSKVAVVVTALLVMAGCGSSDDSEGQAQAPDVEETATSSEGEPKAGGSFTYLFGGVTPPNWDVTNPQVSAMEANTGPGMFLEAVFGVLAYEDFRTGEIVPAMAESITPVDASNWTLTLRPDVEFTDGTPYDAEAVKFNWERHQTITESPQNGVAQTIASMTVVSPTELSVELTEPNVQFDRTVARLLPFIGSPTAIRADAAKFASEPVGAGPFVLKSYVANATATFVRNENYWDSPRPYLDELVITSIFDDQQRYNTMKSGQGDGLMIANGFTLLEDAKRDGFRIVTNLPGGGGTIRVLNHAAEPFNDPAARKAVQAMLDAAGLSKTIDHDATEPLTNLFQKGNPHYDESATIDGYDPAAAQKLLDEYASTHGKPLEFEIYTHPGSVPTASYYQAQLKEFKNVKMGIHTVAPAEYVAGLASGQFDIAPFPFAFGDPIGETIAMFSTTGPKNFGKYSNPNVDELLAEANMTLELSDRAELYHEVQKLLIADQAFIFNQTSPDLQAFTDEVKGLVFAGEGVPLWEQVWLDG